MIVLGVDPGSQRTGYGLLETDGRRPRLLDRGLADLIARARPDALAIEDVFHSANTRTALVLGHVRGVVLLAGAQAGLPVHEFSPATVKQQVTGSGRAEKTQVAYMVTRILSLAVPAEAGDATDALAVALCLACSLPAAALSALAARPGEAP
jgi:crossover junction endodeoxyribonuclease RuvC